MLSLQARLAVTALVLGFAAAVVSPAGAHGVRSADGEQLTVELARAVATRVSPNVYAPTGERIDSTVVVTASRI
jgi:hypothetical protein